MSFEGIGGLIALAALATYGAVKVTGYALKGAAWLTAHGVKALAHGTRSAASAIRSAHSAAEEKRREDAMAELKAMDGVMARSTESLMRDMRKAEETIAAERTAASRKMEAAWDSALRELDAKSGRADEAMLALHDFHTKRSRELAEELRTESAALETRLTTACSDLAAKARDEVTATTTAALEALGKAEGTIAERNERHERYARQALQEAREMLDWIVKHYDCDTFASAQLIAARAKVKATEESLAEGAYVGAAGTAAQASIEVQMLHVYAEQRTASFARAKADVQAAAADLMDMAEASRTLITGDDPEELAEFVSEECGADYWSEGRLKKLWDAAQALQARADALAYSPEFAAEADELRLMLERTRLQLMDEYTRTRLHVVSRHDIVNLARSIIESHEENGWEMTEAPSYVGGDARTDLHLVFMRGSDQRDVFIRNVYDPASGLYKQQIVRHVEEAGMPDEATRRADDDAINASLSDRGVVDAMHVKCDKATAGLKKPL